VCEPDLCGPVEVVEPILYFFYYCLPSLTLPSLEPCRNRVGCTMLLGPGRLSGLAGV
jgi:hypothetical protein